MVGLSTFPGELTVFKSGKRYHHHHHHHQHHNYHSHHDHHHHQHLCHDHDQVPADTDVLITHTPPVGFGDLCSTGVFLTLILIILITIIIITITTIINLCSTGVFIECVIQHNSYDHIVAHHPHPHHHHRHHHHNHDYHHPHYQKGAGGLC